MVKKTHNYLNIVGCRSAMVRQRSAGAAWLSVVAVLCSPALVAARPDVIFHVPEVLVSMATLQL